MKITKKSLLTLPAVPNGKLKNKVSYNLLNGEKLNQEYPETFIIPSRQERENILVGTDVKLVFEAQGEHDCEERMWVTVTDKLPEHYVGLLNNFPSPYKRLQVGADIIFRPEHIINILG
jgi:uncharacterized protein YegJ (DUF2314 family)